MSILLEIIKDVLRKKPNRTYNLVKCTKCGKIIIGSHGNVKFCKVCKEEQIKINMEKAKERRMEEATPCRYCGKLCYGTICRDCLKKGKGSTVSSIYVKRRYREEQNG